MIAKFNPTGTHAHKAYVKVRVDLVPEPGDKTYGIHHVQVPVIPEGGYPGKVDDMDIPIDMEDYNKWLDGLPKVWQVNPCLCHFIKVDPDISLLEFQAKLLEYFDSAAKLGLDDALFGSDSTMLWNIVKTKLGDGQPVSKFTDEDRDKLNNRLSSLESFIGD